MDFNFLAVEKTSEQLSGALGLAPRSKDGGPLYVDYLKKAGVIDKAQFSIDIDPKVSP
jgi:hypothetical protein